MECNSMKFHQSSYHVSEIKKKNSILGYVSRGIGKHSPIITEGKAKQGSDLGGNNLGMYIWESSVF